MNELPRNVNVFTLQLAHLGSDITLHSKMLRSHSTILPFSQTVTEPLNLVCMLYTHALFIYSVTHCLEEQAVCVNDAYLTNWIVSVLYILSENTSHEQSNQIKF